MSDAEPLRIGPVVWVELDPARGREQAGRGPAVVISTGAYNDAIPHLAVVLPVTTRDRGLPHHIRLEGSDLALNTESYAMTEQPRAINRQRIAGTTGTVDGSTLAEFNGWLDDLLITRGRA